MRKSAVPTSKDQTMEGLIMALASHNDSVRVKARHSLVAMGKAAVPSLTKALKSENSLTKWEAAKALGEIGDPSTASTLVEALEDDDFDVRWLAAEGLTKMNVNALKPCSRHWKNGGIPFSSKKVLIMYFMTSQREG